jgi:F-type H+-transporting ATPase subunit gamma
MKMVAAARLKRAQDRVTSARPYAKTMREMMTSLATAVGGEVDHPLLAVRPVKATGFLIISADRGLAGSYNSAILRRALEMLKQYDKEQVKLYVAGRKGVQFFKRRGYNVVEEFHLGNAGVSFSDSRNITRTVRDAFEAGAIDQLFLIYTRFYTAITQKPTDLLLLPIQQPEAGDAAVGATEDYIFVPSADELLRSLLPRYVEGQVYQAFLESIASEHGARMTAMSSATDNAGKMITSLTLQLNRARQAGITREISEIVGGAEALKG